MNEWIDSAKDNWAFWVAGIYALVEFLKWLIKTLSTFSEWFFGKLGVETRKMREKREWNERLQNAEKAIVEIKETSKYNVNMFLEHERQTIDRIMQFKDEIVEKMESLENKQVEMNEKVSNVQEEVVVVKREFELKNANDWRWDILDFFNSSRNNRRHSKEEWDHAIDQVKKYERHVEIHDIDNGVLEEASSWLRNEYQKHIIANDFLES